MRTPSGLNALDAHIRIFHPGNLRRLDWGIALLVLTLAAVGWVALISANRSFAGGTPFYVKQMVFFLIGCPLLLTIACFDHRFLLSMAPLMYAIAIGLLVGVLFAGSEIRGGQRWLALGPFRLQPSEPSKIAYIFMLAWYLDSVGDRIRKLHYFLLTFLIAAVPALLIFRQPNLGTAATFAPVLFAMLYAAGCRRWHLAAIVLLGAALIPIAWGQMADYQKARVMAFVDPSSDPQGSGYHTIQSMVTVGSGGLTGKGYFQGTQTYLSFLPEHHTDFIYSLLAEEWGFVGAVGVLALFAMLFLRGLSFASECPDIGGALLPVGIVTLLAFHVFINIAITLGLLPVTGIPLPFLSYGGSFYLVTMMSIGVLLCVRVRKGMFDA